jgi:signal transduction histidine kinase
MNVSIPADEVRVCMNAPLFEWVIENLCKNAIDAMQGRGNLDLYIYRAENNVVIEVTDTGKGISSGNFKNVFRPGYTTKKRGWGLGLSLAKRIVEEYHHGKIYVKRSQVGVGTTFAVELRLR